MIKDINYKKISWYIVIALAFSWLLAGLQYFLGLSSNYIAKLLFGVAIMWGPALATIIVQKGCLITLGICIFDKKFVSDFK